MISGKILRDAIISGANNINNQRSRVDELNVFPVPDGDTGTNMSMTLNAAAADLRKAGSGEATAGDITPPAGVTIANPDLHIATLAEDGELEIEFTVERGRGYVPAQMNKQDGDEIGRIPVDSIYSPVLKVSYKVEATRVEQRTDFDKLVLEVETDGSIAPNEAVCRASNIIDQYMGAFLSLADIVDEEEGEIPSIFAPEGQEANAELDKQIEDLDLSVRSYNCLKRAGIHSVRQLVEFSENDLLNIRNFGAKSIEEVKDKLISMDLNLKQ